MMQNKKKDSAIMTDTAQDACVYGITCKAHDACPVPRAPDYGVESSEVSRARERGRI